MVCSARPPGWARIETRVRLTIRWLPHCSARPPGWARIETYARSMRSPPLPAQRPAPGLGED